MSKMVMLLSGFAGILMFKLNNISSYLFNFSHLLSSEVFCPPKGGNTGNCHNLTQKGIYEIMIGNGPNDLKNRASYKKIGNCL